ncbi:uncharacterized protein METZ01_LOCUS152460 [marine metagenome]|uniref:Uncharacterized protein n=1 Tax=marine metagenome TaxID=408172 RepID=A0A382ADK9_9ZZZZ
MYKKIERNRESLNFIKKFIARLKVLLYILNLTMSVSK